MNPIDEAILEGLLESRIYSIQSTRFYVDRIHPRPLWTERKFGEVWAAVQYAAFRFGLHGLRHIRSSRAFFLDPHSELEHFDVSTRCELYLQYELQKNMTE